MDAIILKTLQLEEKMQKKLLLSLWFILCSFSYALIPTVTVEPVVGYERVTKTQPILYTKDRMLYGIRMIAGIPLVSAEGEYTHASDTGSFPTLGTDTSDTQDRIKLGIRSTYRMGLLSVFVRGGGQATRNTYSETVASVTTTTVSPVKYWPYLGGGLRFHMSRNLALTGDIVTIFRNFPNMNDNDYQVTAGLTLSYP